MAESIGEHVSVALLYNHLKHTVAPSVLYWHGRRYTLTQMGLHHMVRDGRTLFHIFSMTDGVTYFKLQFDTDTLSWKLLEVASEGDV